MKYKDKTRENLRKKNAEEKNTANDFLLKREDFLLLNELGEKTINQTFKNWKAFHDSLQGDDEKRGFCNILRRNVQEIKILPGEVYLNYLLVYADSDICDFTNSLGEMIYNEIMPRNEDGFMYSFFQINYRQKRMIELKNKFLGKAENNKPYFNRINAVFSEGKMSWYINNSLCGNTIAHAGCPDFRVFMPRSGYADLYKKSHMTDNYEKQIDLLNQLIKTLDNIDIIAPEIRTQKDVDRCLKEVEMACLQLEEVLNLKAPTDEKTAKNNGMIFYNKIWMRCTGHFYYVFDEEDDKKYKRWGHLQFSDYLNSENKVINKWVHLDEKMKLETDKLYESLEKLYKIWCDSDSYLKEEAAIIRSKVANKEE